MVLNGRPAGFRFDGRTVWVWWGQDEQGLDIVAVSGRQVRTFTTEAACRAAFEPAAPVAVGGAVLLLGPEHLRTPDGAQATPGPLAPRPLATGPLEPEPLEPEALEPGSFEPGHRGPGPYEPGAPAPGPLAPGPEMADLGPAQEWAAGRRLVVPAESALDLWNWGVDIARSTGRPFVQRGQIRDACYQKLVASQVPWMFDRESYRPTWHPAQLTALRGTLNDAIHLIRAALR